MPSQVSSPCLRQGLITNPYRKPSETTPQKMSVMCTNIKVVGEIRSLPSGAGLKNGEVTHRKSVHAKMLRIMVPMPAQSLTGDGGVPISDALLRIV